MENLLNLQLQQNIIENQVVAMDIRIKAKINTEIFGIT